jgi:hypothetical protein
VDNPLADLFDLSNASFRHSNLILLLRRRLIFSLARLALLLLERTTNISKTTKQHEILTHRYSAFHFDDAMLFGTG